MNGWGVFSTLRVADGVLFAFDRHYARMKHDAALLRVPFNLPATELEKTLLSLVDANRAFNATLRVCVVRNKGGIFEAAPPHRECDLIAFTADLADWGAGVHLAYRPNARYGASQFSGLKITSWAQNLTWNEDAHERGFDEVILLNEHGQVSECTSANIFTVNNNAVFTPPLASSGCLPGVTRAVLLEEIEVPGISVSERELTPAQLEEADQVFITSTTRDLLPVLTVDRRPLKQHPVLLASLQQAFLAYRATYLSRHVRRQEVLAT